MIPRDHHRRRLEALLRDHPVVAITGARQVGKTTLARQVAEGWAGGWHRFDLEDPDDLARLGEPKLALGGLVGLVIIDEVQRAPELFRTLRVLVDRPDRDTRFLVLGSASRDLLRQSSETLAGRIVYHRLPGFSIDEVGLDRAGDLWRRGGFPRSFLAPSEESSVEWRRSFVQTFLERDLPQLGIQIPAVTLHRFWSMLAHYHGQRWNGAELARAFGVSASTVRRYLDVLSGALVVDQILPWYENLGRRQVKAPKVYLSDSGLLHSLLAIHTQSDLETHPKVGASWEGFALREAVRVLGASPEECYFWATHSGPELDLLVVRGQRRVGVEVKRTTSPSMTRSLRSTVDALGLNTVYLVHAGDHSFPLAEGVRAVAFDDLEVELKPV